MESMRLGSRRLGASVSSSGEGLLGTRQRHHCKRAKPVQPSCSFQNGREQFGNTASGSSRAALTERLQGGSAIDVSREAVSTQYVPPSGARRDFRVSLFDALKFNGPAPEKINGRLAMLGFFLGTLNEFRYGMPIAEQFKAAPGPVALTVFLVSWASLIPIRKGARNEAFGMFTPRAEITNGRAAMLGIAALLFLEYRSYVSFF